MGKFYDSIPDDLASWAMRQPVFFTASAPLNGRHVNISPKGLPSATMKILSPTSVAYLDATGSGCETIAHIYENARVTLMFCSFGTTPRILRFFCTGRVVEWDSPEFDVLLEKMGKARIQGARGVIVLDVLEVCIYTIPFPSLISSPVQVLTKPPKVQTSCGYGVPRLSRNISCDVGKTPEAAFEDRETMGHWTSNKADKNELLLYQQKNNTRSLDGLLGLRTARRGNGERLWLGDVGAYVHRVTAPRESVFVGMFLGIMLVFLAQLGAGVLRSIGIETGPELAAQGI